MVLTTRWNRELCGTGTIVGAPSIGTRIAGDWLTITRGGVFCTSTVGGFTPTSASEDSSRSSAIVRRSLANRFCRSGRYACPREGSVGKSSLVIFRSSKTTMRATLSTCVRAVTNATPKVSAVAPVGLIASATRKSSWLAVQLLTCGW